VQSADDRHASVEQANAKLYGLRLAYAADVKAGRLNTQNIKAVTGRDRVELKRLYRDSFMFKPEAKVVIYSNNRIALPTVDDSVIRHAVFVPFDFSVDPERENPKCLNRSDAESYIRTLPPIVTPGADNPEILIRHIAETIVD
jgi:phage/plasmid-associated DNA primase